MHAKITWRGKYILLRIYQHIMTTSPYCYSIYFHVCLFLKCHAFVNQTSMHVTTNCLITKYEAQPYASLVFILYTDGKFMQLWLHIFSFRCYTCWPQLCGHCIPQMYHICYMWTQLISECRSYYVSDLDFLKICGTFVSQIINRLPTAFCLNGQLKILWHKRKCTCILWLHSQPPRILTVLLCFFAHAPVAQEIVFWELIENAGVPLIYVYITVDFHERVFEYRRTVTYRCMPQITQQYGIVS